MIDIRSQHVRLSVLVFFSVARRDDARVHRAHLVVEPRIAGEGATPEQARQRLLRRLSDRLKADPGLARQVAYDGPVDQGVVELRLPVGRAVVDVTTPVVWIQRPGFWEAFLPRTPELVFLLPADTLPADRPQALARAVAAWRQRRDLSPIEPDTELEHARGDRLDVIGVGAHVPWRSAIGAGLDLALLGLWDTVETPQEALEAVAEDLLDRDDLVGDLVPWDGALALYQRLFLEEAPAPLAIVGPAGSGRTTRVHAAVLRAIAADRRESPGGRRGRRLWLLDPGRVITGQSRVAQWEGRFQRVLSRLAAGEEGERRSPDVLFVDAPLALLSVGRTSGGSLTLATLLRPKLEQRAFPCVIEATPEVWQRMQERDPGFCGLFEVTRVTPPGEAERVELAVAHAERLAVARQVDTYIPALRRLVELDRLHPAARGEPAGLVERVHRLFEVEGRAALGPQDATACLSTVSGLRPEILDRSQRLVDAELDASIASRLIGQPDAVAAIAAVIHVLHAGLARPGRPVASMLLVGPTGVGKTEAARVLTSLLFTRPSHLVRVDMNEHVGPAAVHRLLGSETEEGLLTGPIRHRPEAVLLLDEIEKAHPTVLDLLLQLLDEGRLTDGAGRLVRFHRVVVVMTSNVGADEVARSVGFDRAAASGGAAFRGAVTRTFRPEFINRIDRIVPFRPLGRRDVEAIALRLIAAAQRREGFLRRVVFLDAAPGVAASLAARGYDPAMGARALKREVERALVAPLASLFASLPPEAPVRIEVGAGADGVSVKAHVLRHADRLDTFSAPEPVDPDEVRALWALLDEGGVRAEAGPDGVSVVGADRAEARDRLRPLVQRLEVYEPPLAEWSTRDLVRLRRRSRSYSWSSGPRLTWSVGQDWRTVKGWLLANLHVDPAPEQEHISDAVAVLAARAALDGEPDACVLSIRPVGSMPGGEAASAAGIWLRAIGLAVQAAGGQVVVQARAAGGAVRPTWDPGAQAWELHITGPGLSRLARGEVGLHAIWGLCREPTDESARLFRVMLHIGSEHVAVPEIVRTLVFEEHHADAVRVYDHRLDATVRLREDEALPLAWWWTLQEARG